MTWQVTLIAMMLTLFVSVDLGERGYVYYKVYDAKQTVKQAHIDECITNSFGDLNVEGLTPAKKFNLHRAWQDACELDYNERQR